jgi:hypothetical protein
LTSRMEGWKNLPDNDAFSQIASDSGMFIQWMSHYTSGSLCVKSPSVVG